MHALFALMLLAKLAILQLASLPEPFCTLGPFTLPCLALVVNEEVCGASLPLHLREPGRVMMATAAQNCISS